MLLKHALPGVQLFEAADGLAAVQLADIHQPSIVFMDITMPGLNGIEVLRRLHQTHPSTKVIMLSMHRDEDRVLTAMGAGASAYLLKDAPIDEVSRAIEIVQAGGTYLSAGLSSVVKGLLSSGALPAGPLSTLTARQREILQLIAEGHSTKEIGFQLQVSPKTVESHRRFLMQRLNIFDVAGLARFAVRAGLVAADC